MDPDAEQSESEMRPYRRLFPSLALPYVVMFAVMYARVDTADNIFLSPTQAYMAGLMVAPILLIMLLTMGHMFNNRRLNGLLVAIMIGLAALFLALVRTQTAVGNEQFLGSMIPHHAAAILVCEMGASNSYVSRSSRHRSGGSAR